LQTKFVQQIRHVFYVQQRFSAIHGVYEIVWKNTVETERLQLKYNTEHALYMLGN